MIKTLDGVVTEVCTAFTRVVSAGAPDHLKDQLFINGSINSVPADLRVVGTKVTMTYETAPAYGLWFVRAHKEES